jgi:hypothetical protein
MIEAHADMLGLECIGTIVERRPEHVEILWHDIGRSFSYAISDLLEKFINGNWRVHA